MGRAPRLVGARTNLGGLLTTLGRLPPAVDAQPWAFDSKVDPHAFHVLDYAAASAGIARTQRENRDGWWTHARHSRAFILNAAARIQDRSLAILFGAVKAFDLPLVELAARFERVVLGKL